MFKLPWTIVLFSSICAVTPGQDVNRDLKLSPQQLASLREYLELTDSVTISVAKPLALPATYPTKVFVAVGPDPSVQKDFTKRIIRWNEKDGMKYGALEIVGTMEEADVLLVVLSRLLERHELPGPTMDQRAGVPGAPRYPIELGPQPMPPDVDILRTCYIISRSPDKLEIVAKASYFDKRSPPWVVEPGKIICEEFFKLMKKRVRG